MVQVSEKQSKETGNRDIPFPHHNGPRRDFCDTLRERAGERRSNKKWGVVDEPFYANHLKIYHYPKFFRYVDPRLLVFQSNQLILCSKIIWSKIIHEIPLRHQ